MHLYPKCPLLSDSKNKPSTKKPSLPFSHLKSLYWDGDWPRSNWNFNLPRPLDWQIQNRLIAAAGTYLLHAPMELLCYYWSGSHFRWYWWMPWVISSIMHKNVRSWKTDCNVSRVQLADKAILIIAWFEYLIQCWHDRIAACGLPHAVLLSFINSQNEKQFMSSCNNCNRTSSSIK